MERHEGLRALFIKKSKISPKKHILTIERFKTYEALDKYCIHTHYFKYWQSEVFFSLVRIICSLQKVRDVKMRVVSWSIRDLYITTTKWIQTKKNLVSE